jgi:hypothetical protein
MYIYYNISLNSSQNGKYFRQKLQKYENTVLVLKKSFFFPKIVLFMRYRAKEMVEPGRSQMTSDAICVLRK